ncbi:tetratricopeptide repeat protein [Flavobacterium sp.]|uniref:tetratricopeptide repeat protein n=1 Tax=Flavobacterium sp. TaxID=239 RepID=UPI00391A7790
MKFSILGLLLVCTSLAFAQSNEGFWDNIRTTNETIILNAGKRKAIKTADFPVGTTEVVYRISLLDDNQKISSSLVSVLKAIPDPTGISQGAAGTVFLLSSISGDDKCKFYVFTNENDALQYEKTGVASNACVSQEEPVNKAAKLLTEKSKCIPQGIQNLWFGFQSDNWVMKEKIILEVVPWVNYNLRSGWTVENRKSLLKEIEQLEIAKKVSNKNLFLGNFMEVFIAKYAYSDYKKLLPAEKAKAMDGFAEESLVKSGQLNSYLEMVRSEATKLNFSNKSEEAILKIQKEIIEKNRAKAIDYGLLGTFYLSSRQFVKAEEAYLKAISMNPSELNYRLQLAHIYMYTDRVNKSKDLHKKYQQNNLANHKSWIEQTKIDFEQFKNNGFGTENFKKILRVLD